MVISEIMIMKADINDCIVNQHEMNVTHFVFITFKLASFSGWTMPSKQIYRLMNGVKGNDQLLEMKFQMKSSIVINNCHLCILTIVKEQCELPIAKQKFDMKRIW